MQLSVEVPLFKEGERYTFKVIQGTDIIFRGTVLVTQFNDTNYTINNNEFVVDVDTDSDSKLKYMNKKKGSTKDLIGVAFCRNGKL